MKMETYEVNEVGIVYGYLINAFTNAHREKDKDKAERVYRGLEVLRELWPDECTVVEKKFNAKIV